jgi:NTP pyrophosphatase (non-canonical NTP hydrolase)
MLFKYIKRKLKPILKKEKDMSIESLSNEIFEFNKERDWEKFHSPKDNVLSLFIETAELAELYRWKEDNDVDVELVSKELADIFYWLIMCANRLNIDLEKSLSKKMIENREKYPIELCYGKSTKYTELKGAKNDSL